ncbi:MAG TPA: hypothetical protein PLR79_07275, partial [Acinetobacter sp.]|nr:hypothetical protein [Acinetobacter sp.]
MFEKTDNVVVIIPEKYGEMYGIYLSTLAAWTGKGNAYMVYNYDDPIYDQDASNKEVTLRASLRNSLGVDRSAFKATHVNLYAENRQCSFKALFAKNLSVWRNANMVYALDQLGVTALVESQNMVARQVRLDKDRMLASAYAYDHCAYVR